MSFQIASVILYSYNGETRIVPFKRGKLNILTGPTLRGKTQLIEIIDYCLGRGTPALVGGPITQHVAWYAVKLYLPIGEAFVARRSGQRGNVTSEEIYLDKASVVRVPTLDELRPTHNLEGLTAELDDLVGITSNEVKPAESSGRDPFRANIRHALLLCFQAKHEITNPSILFHRQGESAGAVGRDLLATLPYFLGAMSADSVAAEAEATQARRELRVAERELREESLVIQDRRSRANSLVAEAVAVGLIDGRKERKTYEQLIEELTAVSQWAPRSDALQAGGDAYQSALRDRAAALRELRGVRRDIDQARAYAAEQDAFVAELREQQARLASIGLYAHLTDQSELSITEAIRSELTAVDTELATAIPPSSDLGAYISAREEERSELLSLIQRLDASLEALSVQADLFKQVRSSDFRQAAVVGRISLFLESIQAVTAEAARAQRVTRLKSRLGILEEQIAALDQSDNLTIALGQIGGLMRAWATELQHEYKDALWRLDLRQGTVVTNSPSRGRVAMNLIGGGRNLLGCHLFAHMALHLWFRGNAAPTPAFIIFDRPTHGLYDSKRQSGDSVENQLGEKGQQDISRILKWLASLVDGLDGQFQVIVIENITISNDHELRPFVAADWWKDDEYLVPTSWEPLPSQTKSD